MARKNSVLIVDDEAHQRATLGKFLKDSGFEVFSVASGADALDVLKGGAEVQLLLTDLTMPGMDGIELIRQARAAQPTLDCLVMTAYGTIATAIDALKAGAADYLLKPLEFDAVLLRVQQILRTRRLEERAERLERENENLRGGRIVADSKQMKDLLVATERVAKTDATVLLVGETGTGKEVLARCIHDRSQRAKGPFVAVNCSAIPENLLESEFFGHEKGAFTGADRRVTGFFEQADGGMLFLDEIGEMDLKLQAKVLRAVEERRIRRVGGGADISVDVRFVAATHRDLKRLVTEGRFREDLYFRLNVVQLFIQPLRERPDDIAGLVRYFAERHAKTLNVATPAIDDSYLAAIKGYPFPGNVRELSNTVERSLIYMTGDRLMAESLPGDLKGQGGASPRMAVAPASAHSPVSGAVGSGALADRVAEYEKQMIADILSSNGNDVEKAAETLQVSRSTLYAKMSKYGLK